jgi:hypothetical protein
METLVKWHKPADQQPENYTFVMAKIVGESKTWVEIVGYADGNFQLPPGRSATPKVELWAEIPTI